MMPALMPNKIPTVQNENVSLPSNPYCRCLFWTGASEAGRGLGGLFSTYAFGAAGGIVASNSGVASLMAFLARVTTNKRQNIAAPTIVTGTTISFIQP